MKLTKGYKTVTDIKEVRGIYYYLNNSGKLIKRSFEDSNVESLREAIRKQLIFLPESEIPTTTLF